MQQSVSGLITNTQYLYDAEGRRVAKGSISSFSCDTTANGFTATAVYVLGPDGEQMTEMAANSSGGWQWAHTNVFAPGLTATDDADLTGQSEGALYFHLSDWLGTRRQQTDYVGNPVLNFTGLPYGDGLATVPVSNTDVSDATEHHFTGKSEGIEVTPVAAAKSGPDSVGRASSPGRVNAAVTACQWSWRQTPGVLRLHFDALLMENVKKTSCSLEWPLSNLGMPFTRTIWSGHPTATRLSTMEAMSCRLKVKIRFD